VDLNTSEQQRRPSIWLSLAGGSAIASGQLLNWIEEIPADGLAIDFIQGGFQAASESSELRETRRLSHLGLPARQIYSRLRMASVRETADLLLPIFERSNGRRGLLSVPLSIPPEAAAVDLARAAEELWEGINRPNLIVALRSSPAGLEAFYGCLVKGMNLELRSILTLEEFNQVRHLQTSAMHKRAESGQASGHIIAGAAIDLRCIDRVVDHQLSMAAEGGGLLAERAEWLRGKAGLATADLILAQQDASEGDEDLPSSGYRTMYVRWTAMEQDGPSNQTISYPGQLLGSRSILTLDIDSALGFNQNPAAQQESLRDISVSRAQMEAIGALGIDLEPAMAAEHERLARELQDQQQDALDQLDEQVRTFQAELGELAGDLEHSLAGLQAQGINRRIWESERVADGESTNWLGQPQVMSTRVSDLEAWTAEQFEVSRFDSLIVIGGYEQTFPLELLSAVADHRMEVRILNRLEPTGCRAAVRGLKPAGTAVLVLDWDSEHIESQYMFYYLWHWFESKTDDPGEHFSALARPGSRLHELAEQHNFRAVRPHSAVPGAACGSFGMESVLPAIIAGINIEPVLASARKMVERCSLSAEPDEHPGLYLAAFLDAMLARDGRRLTMLSDAAAGPFRRWLTVQLDLACRGRRGLWSVISTEPPGHGAKYDNAGGMAYLRVTGDLDKKMLEWREAQHPVLIYQLDGTASDAGAAMLQWHYAADAAGKMAGSDRTKRGTGVEARRSIDGLLKDFAQNGEFELGWPLPETGHVRIIGQSRTEIPGDLPLTEFWEEVMQTLPEFAGVRLNLFMHLPAGSRRQWERVQRLLRDQGRWWTSLETDRLHSPTRDGVDDGAVEFIISVRKTKDISVPEVPWSFNTIQRARARAALSLAVSSGFPAVHIEFTSGVGFKPWVEALRLAIEHNLDDKPAGLGAT
jgi:transaldolase